MATDKLSLRERVRLAAEQLKDEDPQISEWFHALANGDPEWSEEAVAKREAKARQRQAEAERLRLEVEQAQRDAAYEIERQEQDRKRQAARRRATSQFQKLIKRKRT